MTKELNRTDDRLLRLADRGMSGLEMEAETGIPAAQAVVRVKELLAERDIWSDLERQKMNIIALQRVKGRLLEQVDSRHADVEQIEAFVKATQVMGTLLEGLNNVTDEQLEKITQAQARALVNMMSFAWDKAIARLQEEFPQAPVALITDVFNDGLRQSALEMQIDL